MSTATDLPTIGNRPQNDRYPYDTFKVGDRANERMYTDVCPCTVVEVKRGGAEVTVRMDDAKLSEGEKPEFVPGGFVGHCTNQAFLKYDIFEDPNGKLRTFTLRKWRGRYVWTPKGGSPDGIQRLRKGWKRFYDYNF